MPFHKNEAIRSRLVERFNALNLANGRPPTVRELAKDLGRASSTVGYHINILVSRGTLRRSPGTRNLSLAPIDYDAILASDDGLSLMRHLVAAHQDLKPEEASVYPADMFFSDLEPVKFLGQCPPPGNITFKLDTPINPDEARQYLDYLMRGHDGY